MSQKHVPLGRKSPPTPLPSLRGHPLSVRIKREFCHFRRVFSCILRCAGSDPQAERGRGEVNLSPKEVPTLRPRVGGFFHRGLFGDCSATVRGLYGGCGEAEEVALLPSWSASKLKTMASEGRSDRRPQSCVSCTVRALNVHCAKPRCLRKVYSIAPTMARRGDQDNLDFLCIVVIN